MSDSNPRSDAAVLFTVTAVGAAMFALFHVFLYSAAFAIELGAEEPANHVHIHFDEVAVLADPVMLWFTAIFFSLAVVPPLVAAVGRGVAAAWTTVVVGGLLVLGNVADGFAHGFAEGAWYSTAIAVIAVGLPGVFALRSALQWARQAKATDETPAPTSAAT